MYTLVLHKNLTTDRWQRFSKSQQILMITTELNRAQTWIEKNQNYETNQCYERAFELFDLTIADPKWQSGLKELLRARDILAELYLQNTKDELTNKQLMDAIILLSTEAYNMLH